MNKTRFTYLILILVIIFASVVRVYKISEAPPSLTWDEAAVGYNAWTIANYARDETGKFLPLTFRSFLEEKHPIHIYATAVFVKIFGLSEFSTRIPAALFGVLNVIIIFFLTRLLFKNEYLALITAFVLALSPYAIHFSRFNHELNFSLFFTLLGVYLFMKGVEEKSSLLTFSFLSFSIMFITYLSAKLIIVPFCLLLCLLYSKELRELKTYLYGGLLWFLLLGVIVAFNPALLGASRAKQVSFPNERIKDTYLYHKTNSEFLGRINLVTANYFSHFTPDYLFQRGDKNPRLSSQVSGEFFKIESLFFILGLMGLILLRRRPALILLALALMAPLPASFSNEVPHAGRAMFMVGSWHIVIGYGVFVLLKFIKFNYLKILTMAIIIFIYSLEFNYYLLNYYSKFALQYAIDWQYGMKEVVQYVKNHPEYSRVYMTNVRSQPYIFFLFFTQKPLNEYLKEVEYNNSESRSSSLVASFDRYQFEYWDPIESSPDLGRLYILTSNQYDGLRYKSKFKVKKIIYYPNKTTAFYLVSVN